MKRVPFQLLAADIIAVCMLSTLTLWMILRRSDKLMNTMQTGAYAALFSDALLLSACILRLKYTPLNLLVYTNIIGQIDNRSAGCYNIFVREI